MNQTAKPYILVIDDEEAILKTLKEALEDEGFNVETLSQPHQALDTIGRLIPDVILLDIFMPNSNGLELLEKIKIEYPRQHVIIISGYGTIPIALQALKKGAHDFIEKPLNLDEILEKLASFKTGIEQSFNEPFSIDPGTSTSYRLIGKSYLFLELMRQVEQLAILPLPLLIYGKHGTGKTEIAQFAHAKSPLAHLPFHIFRCTHVHTAEEFNLFLDRKGTLYFKNIDHLSKELQTMLLTFLETNQENDSIRIIASADPSLFHAVSKGIFDTMLFYHLNIIPLELPTLNRRAYDIPLLVDYFLDYFKKQYKKTLVFTARSLRVLRNHRWEGNIQELKNLLEKLTLLAPDDHFVVTPEFLLSHLAEKESQLIEEQSFNYFSSFKEASKAFEKKFLLYMLKKNHYDLTQVSDQLCLDLEQLRAKILELNIEIKKQLSY